MRFGPVKRFALSLLLCVAACHRATPGGDPNGVWVGDFGPGFYDRNTISLELHWDGKELTGMILPGVQGGRMYRNFAGIPIENGTFDSQTGQLKFEAIYKPRSRHYIIQGTITEDTIKGSWDRPDENRSGDFKLSRSSQ